MHKLFELLPPTGPTSSRPDSFSTKIPELGNTFIVALAQNIGPYVYDKNDFENEICNKTLKANKLRLM